MSLPPSHSPLPAPEPEALRAGLLVLHGNRLEDLAEAVLAWLGRHPLAPLESEHVLVQSNGMAEWFKMTWAEAHGICASARVELPARFLWRAYREVLGPEAVPRVGALDKQPLTWRLMRALPELAREAAFGPVSGFLDDGPPASPSEGAAGAGGRRAIRRLQLAERLADLLDQYQVYRSDWLSDWARGDDRLRARSHATPARDIPDDQLWQPALWRALLESLTAEERASIRPELHRRFLAALREGRVAGRLPRRVVLFGTTHVPAPMLEALSALSGHCQVLMAVPNPCRFHWADIVEGRELLAAARRRHAWRDGRDLSTLPVEQLPAFGHPLLAAWGRQARDFIRQLDDFDDAETARARFEIPRVDLFDDSTGTGSAPTDPRDAATAAPAASPSLLAQLQARIRDLVPDAEKPAAPAVPLAPDDRSIVFHVAHGPMREVEVLHDQLLHLLAQPALPGRRALAPRDVVVMVPDIETFAPAIRAVFGQHARSDARHIPWAISDQGARGRHPLVVAVERLLDVREARWAASEVRDLIDVPAIARRFGVAEDERPQLLDWIAASGIRWGLDAAHRAALGLAACGETHSWQFGLERWLLGYAAGESRGDEAFDGIEPFADVGGLAAAAAGSLAELLGVLRAWWRDAGASRTPREWAARLRALLERCFLATDQDERAVLAALDDALAAWLDDAEAGAFEEPVELAVVREAWFAVLDAPSLAQRFRAGGVTFCTLLPLRAIPFEVVCLLGMNEGDYPRAASRSDFDLMALPGVARAGDRSRRDDDRQLMLDALLSARRVLHVSWAGRNARDNSAEPPSVLVAQLREHLEAVWGKGTLAARTVEHPLQPFSRRYFERRDPALFTFAAEWRQAHAGPAGPAGPEASDRDVDVARARAAASSPADTHEAPPIVLTLAELARFVRNPVRDFFRHRLRVRFDEQSRLDDDEPFGEAGLEGWRWRDEALAAVQRRLVEEGAGDAQGLARLVNLEVGRLARAGRLPAAAPGRAVRAAIEGALSAMFARALEQQGGAPAAGAGTRAIRLEHREVPGLLLTDHVSGLGAGDGGPVALELKASRLLRRQGHRPALRPDQLVATWLRGLALAAVGPATQGVVIGADAVVRSPRPEDGAEARATLLALMLACHENRVADHPLPTAVKTGVAWLHKPASASAVYGGSRGAGGRAAGAEGSEACLARLFPDFAALQAAGFEEASARLYGPYARWLASVTFEVHPEAALDAEDDE